MQSSYVALKCLVLWSVVAAQSLFGLNKYFKAQEMRGKPSFLAVKLKIHTHTHIYFMIEMRELGEKNLEKNSIQASSLISEQFNSPTSKGFK